MIAAALLALVAGAAAEQRYAVVVGVNTGFGPDAPLRYAESDAHRMAELLQDLGGVPASRVALLQGADADDLRATFADVSARIAREVPPGERSSIVVYYSGHADGQGLHMEGTELPLRELREAVVGMPADLRVLVMDACQAGEILRAKGGTPVAPFPIAAPGTGVVEGVAVLTAAAAGEDAQESERLQGGVFTHHLLAGLAGAADTSGDHRVTLQEAYRYAHARTLSTTSRAPVVQHPSYAFDLQGQTEVALTVLDGARRAGRLVLEDAGLYVIFDLGETRLVAEVEVGKGGTVALPEGAYRVRRRMPDRVYEGAVTVQSGADTRLATANLRSQPYGQSARRGQTSETYTAIALTVGGGVQGALRDGVSTGPLALAGLRADLPWFTLVGRARYAHATAENAFLSMEQHAPGGELAALRLVDVGPASFGLGVGGGLGGVLQRFETEGEAPERWSLVGQVGPIGRAELAVSPRLTLGVEAAWDIHVYPVAGADGASSIETSAVPRAALDLTAWVR